MQVEIECGEVPNGCAGPSLMRDITRSIAGRRLRTASSGLGYL